MENFLDENVNNLVKQIDPDYKQCFICNQFFHKKVFSHFYDDRSPEFICPNCQVKNQNSKEIPIDKIEKTIKDFEEEYQKNPNFLNFEQN